MTSFCERRALALGTKAYRTARRICASALFLLILPVCATELTFSGVYEHCSHTQNKHGGGNQNSGQNKYGGGQSRTPTEHTGGVNIEAQGKILNNVLLTSKLTYKGDNTYDTLCSAVYSGKWYSAGGGCAFVLSKDNLLPGVYFIAGVHGKAKTGNEYKKNETVYPFAADAELKLSLQAANLSRPVHYDVCLNLHAAPENARVLFCAGYTTKPNLNAKNIPIVYTRFNVLAFTPRFPVQIGLENETDFIIGEPQYDGAHSRTGGTLYVNTGKGGTYFAGSDVDLYSLFFFDYTAVRVKAGVRFIL